MILSLIESVFVEVFSFGIPLVIQNAKYVSLSNEQRLARPPLINLNPNELCYYPFIVNLDIFSGWCNTLNDSPAMAYSSNRICDPKIQV